MISIRTRMILLDILLDLLKILSLLESLIIQTYFYGRYSLNGLAHCSKLVKIKLFQYINLVISDLACNYLERMYFGFRESMDLKL